MPNYTLTVKLNWDALALIEDFLKYGHTNLEDVADAMHYDHLSFKQRLESLEKAYKKATR